MAVLMDLSQWPLCRYWILCFKCKLSADYSHFLSTCAGCWLRMGWLKQWNASVTSRSHLQNERGRTMRTAGGSTTQKWPENLLSSARKTGRIPGSAADEMEGDETEGCQWTGSEWGQKMEESINLTSLLHLNDLWEIGQNGFCIVTISQNS